MWVGIVSLVHCCVSFHLECKGFVFCLGLSVAPPDVDGYSITSSLLFCHLDCKGFVLGSGMSAALQCGWLYPTVVFKTRSKFDKLLCIRFTVSFHKKSYKIFIFSVYLRRLFHIKAIHFTYPKNILSFFL